MIGHFTNRERTVLEAFRRYAITQVRYAFVFGLALANPGDDERAIAFRIVMSFCLPHAANGRKLE